MAQVKENLINEAANATETSFSLKTGGYEEVYSVLSSISVEEWTDTKGKDSGKATKPLNYLPWAAAWGIMKEHFPDATFRYIKSDVGWNFHVANGYGWVEVGVTVRGVELIAQLAITDNSNKALALDKITQTDVVNTSQRALVKACALHGLGLQLWLKGTEAAVDWGAGSEAASGLPNSLQPSGLNMTASQTQPSAPAIAPQVPAPQIPAPQAPVQQDPVQQPQQNVAPAPAATATKVTYCFPGDGKTLNVSGLAEPIVFRTSENYSDTQLIEYSKKKFTLTDQIFVEAGVLNLSIKDALNTLIAKKKTEALKVLAEKLEQIDFTKPEESTLPVEEKPVLFAIGCIMHHCLKAPKGWF